MKKIMPDMLSAVFVPFLTMLIMLPIAYCVLAPLGGRLGDLVGNALFGFSEIGGFVGGAVAGLAGVRAYMFGATDFLSVLGLADPSGANGGSFMMGTIACALAFIVSAAVVFFFGFSKEQIEEDRAAAVEA